MTILLNIRYFLEYLVLRLIIGFVRLFPLDTAVSLSAKIWSKLAPRGRRHRRALANLAKAFPEKTEQEREEIALAMWANLGRVMAETMLLDRILKDPDRIILDNDFINKRYNGKMGSAICVSMHSGNWELSSLPMVRAGIKPAGVYRLVNNPYVDMYLRSTRKELYPGGLFARGKSGGVNAGADTARMIGSYVRQGGRLGFLCDLHDRKGIEVPFFGHPAKSTAFPAMLARRVGSRMWIGRCIRIGKESRFKVEARELKVPRTDDADTDIQNIIADMQHQFEIWIREYPEQWMWSNRRWS
ncbi:MAG: lipid A biosynthesis acyltransferase [Pseudomonadota bacterium]